MNYGMTQDTPRFRSHFKGMGDLMDLEPNDPILQNIDEGTIYGNSGGNYNTPTPADITAGQTIPFLAQLKDNEQTLILFGGLALAAVILIKLIKK